MAEQCEEVKGDLEQKSLEFDTMFKQSQQIGAELDELKEERGIQMKENERLKAELEVFRSENPMLEEQVLAFRQLKKEDKALDQQVQDLVVKIQESKDQVYELEVECQHAHEQS